MERPKQFIELLRQVISRVLNLWTRSISFIGNIRPKEILKSLNKYRMRAKEILKKWWVWLMGVLATIVIIFGFVTDVIPTIWNELFKNKVTSEVIQFHEWISEDSYKIIILPFDEKCKDGSADVGSIIADRLSEKAKNDSLNIEVYYKEDLIPSRSLGDSASHFLYLDSADLILYGRSMTGGCSEEGSQICLNYETDSIVNFSSKTYDYQAATVMEITRGALQGEIDDHLFYFCGLSEYHSKNFRRSLELLKRIKLHTYDSYYYMGNNCSFLKEYETGIKYYKKAISSSNYSLNAYLNMGTAFHSLGRDSVSLGIYDYLLEWVPPSSKILIHRASSYRSLGMYKEALNDLNRALELDSASIQLLYLRSMIKRDLNQYSEALNDLNIVIKQRPNWDIAYNTRGSIYFAIDSILKAKKDYLKSLELKPKLSQTHYNLGHIYLVQKKFIKAKEEFDLCIEYLGNDELLYIDEDELLSFSSLRESHIVKSLGYNFRAVVNHEIAKKTRDPWVALVDSAIIDFNIAIDFDSTYAYAYCRRGRIFAARQLYEDALNDFSNSIRLDPNNGCGYRWRAMTIVEMYRFGYNVSEEQKELALSDISTAISFGQEDYEEYFTRWAVYEMIGKSVEAIKDYNRGLRLKVAKGS